MFLVRFVNFLVKTCLELTLGEDDIVLRTRFFLEDCFRCGAGLNYEAKTLFFLLVGVLLEFGVGVPLMLGL